MLLFAVIGGQQSVFYHFAAGLVGGSDDEGILTDAGFGVYIIGSQFRFHDLLQKVHFKLEIIGTGCIGFGITEC